MLEEKVDPEAPAVDGAPFDLALSRATLAPPDWLRLGLRLAPQAIVLTAAGDPPEPPPGASILRRREYAIPSSAARRVATLYRTTLDGTT